MGPFLVVAIVALIIAALIYAYYAEKKHKEELLAWVRAAGFRFRAEKDYGIPSRFAFFDPLCQGDNRYAYNIIEGEVENLPFLMFDYHYETYSTDNKGRRQTHHHHFTATIFETGLSFPTQIKIRPENFLDKLAAVVGFDDIDFESSEFSKAFHVKSKDRKLAYDVIHARMMEYLLAHRGYHVEIEHHAICVTNGESGKLKVPAYDAQLRFTREVLSLLPEYLVRDLSARS
ncbi:MAG: DUF3137 domain-containing protein [Planctomycetes bacterium]|nr:DUF3137 domain-containing protein [Planctomycetota bacterium]NUQ35910.1 DUF3137 domain-containing protein [Planctomycetaceae bacterium]